MRVGNIKVPVIDMDAPVVSHRFMTGVRQPAKSLESHSSSTGPFSAFGAFFRRQLVGRLAGLFF